MAEELALEADRWAKARTTGDALVKRQKAARDKRGHFS